ncbi:hypothetical protein J6590_024241 [Homalodisca vitripennis]|nr:hypothetical protein J6590_024241 [Homalodisca vitripennis]
MKTGDSRIQVLKILIEARGLYWPIDSIVQKLQETEKPVFQMLHVQQFIEF